MENIPPRPNYNFTPAAPIVEQLIKKGVEIEKHYYLHPKLDDCYRYKYMFEETVWWIDVDLAGESMQIWKLDGQTWFEGKAAAVAGGDDEEEDA